jgi:serine/threonine protein kinase, bacterial
VQLSIPRTIAITVVILLQPKITMQNQPKNPKNIHSSHQSQTWKKVMMLIIGSVIGINVLTGCDDSKPASTAQNQPRSTENTEPAAKRSEKPTEAKMVADQEEPAEAPVEKPSRKVENRKNNAAPQPAARNRENNNNQANDGTDATLVGNGQLTIYAGPKSSSKQLHVAYGGDRIQVVDVALDERTSWYKIYFPKSGADGWVKRDRVEMDPGASPPSLEEKMIEADTSQPTTNLFNEPTNATIVGSGDINIRSGPGTKYSSPHVAYSGDRVTVGESVQGDEGYTWFRVYFPQSGADGWIAKQLLDLDFD